MESLAYDLHGERAVAYRDRIGRKHFCPSHSAIAFTSSNSGPDCDIAPPRPSAWLKHYRNGPDQRWCARLSKFGRAHGPYYAPRSDALSIWTHQPKTRQPPRASCSAIGRRIPEFEFPANSILPSKRRFIIRPRQAQAAHPANGPGEGRLSGQKDQTTMKIAALTRVADGKSGSDEAAC